MGSCQVMFNGGWFGLAVVEEEDGSWKVNGGGSGGGMMESCGTGDDGSAYSKHSLSLWLH